MTPPPGRAKSLAFLGLTRTCAAKPVPDLGGGVMVQLAFVRAGIGATRSQGDFAIS
jgi:hypothetical protein